MAMQHTSRTGKTYYLHAGVTPKGNPKYFFSLSQEGELVDGIPAGFEVYENVDGQVFLRRIQKQIVCQEELALVEAALRKHSEIWQYRTEIKKDTIIVYECGTDIAGINEMIMTYARRTLSEAEKLSHAHYMAVMRFILEDKKSRQFVIERFCFKGSIDDWICIDGPAALAELVNKYIKHLGQESFYELV